MTSYADIAAFHNDAKTLSIASGDHKKDMAGLINSFIREHPVESILSAMSDSGIYTEKKKITIVSETLSFLFDSSPLKEQLVSKEFAPFLANGLLSPEPEIKRVCLEKVSKTSLAAFEDVETILSSLIKLLCDIETNIAQSSSDIIAEFALSTDKNFDVAVKKLVLLNNALASRLLQVSDKNIKADKETQLVLEQITDFSLAEVSTFLMRTLFLLFKLSTTSETVCEKLLKAKAFGVLPKLVSCDDLLLQINLLNILPLFSQTLNGFRFLLLNNILEEIATLSGSKLFSDTLSVQNLSLIKDYALRTFSVFAAYSVVYCETVELKSLLNEKNKVLEKYPLEFLTIINEELKEIYEHKNNANVSQVNGVLNTIGTFLGNSFLAFNLFLQNQELCDNFVKVSCIVDEKILICALNTFADAFNTTTYNYHNYSFDTEHNFDSVFNFVNDNISFVKTKALDESSFQNSVEEVSENSKRLLLNFAEEYSKSRSRNNSLVKYGSDIIGVLLYFIEVPINDLHCVTFKLLNCIARQKAVWGLKNIFANKYSEEVLLSRTLDLSKEAKEWRFSVIENVFNNPVAGETLGGEIMKKLELFLQKGPFIGEKRKDNSVEFDAV